MWFFPRNLCLGEITVVKSCVSKLCVRKKGKISYKFTPVNFSVKTFEVYRSNFSSFKLILLSKFSYEIHVTSLILMETQWFKDFSVQKSFLDFWPLNYSGSPLVWVLWVLKHPQFLKVWVLAPAIFSIFFTFPSIFIKMIWEMLRI